MQDGAGSSGSGPRACAGGAHRRVPQPSCPSSGRRRRRRLFLRWLPLRRLRATRRGADERRNRRLLILVAAALAAMTTAYPGVGAWVAVLTTAGGAGAAYTAAPRYEFLWIEYSRTASELRRLLERRTAVDSRPLSGSDLPAECEQAISVQNQAWMARRGQQTWRSSISEVTGCGVESASGAEPRRLARLEFPCMARQLLAGQPVLSCGELLLCGADGCSGSPGPGGRRRPVAGVQEVSAARTGRGPVDGP
ncbi:SLATT domain-containing protein [Streptomyces flavofungini]|uniref:SLATT domain-containing protein n=1 Tax=Streptomyces flavofungini TaxID=68200 RepID=UPI00357175FB